MDKQKIYVYYKGSGVKTLEGFGTLFIVLGTIAATVIVICFFGYLMGSYKGDTVGALMLNLLPTSVGLYAFGAICKGLSTIAKTAVFKRQVLEEQYDFLEPHK